MKIIWAKTLERVWQEDKDLMRKVRPKIRTDYDSKLPDWRRAHDDVFEAYVQGYKGEYPRLTKEIAEKSLESMVACIERFVGQKITVPQIEVFPVEDYEARVESAQNKEEALGGRDLDKTVNYAHVCERQGLILIADRCLTSLPVHKPTGDVTIYDKKWSLCAYAKHDLDFSIASGLALSAIHQLIQQDPGELKKAAKGDLEKVLAVFKLMGIAELAKENKGLVPLYLLEKLDYCWQVQASIDIYNCCSALADVDGVAAAARSYSTFKHTGDVQGDQTKIKVISR